MNTPTAYSAGIACLIAGYASHTSGLDLIIAKSVYTSFGGFPRNAVFLKAVMHEGMRALTTMALGGLALVLLWDAFSPRTWLAYKRAPLRIFLLCAAVFIGGIAALKSVTTPACPWDLAMFSGDRTLVNYSETFDLKTYGQGHCFPAGHSTSGYVWLALAFLFCHSAYTFRRAVLFLLPIGFSLSAAQIIRGAHFLSHELTTLGIGLLVFSALPQLFIFKSKSQPEIITDAC